MEIIQTFTNEQEVLLYAKVNGFDKGRTDSFLQEYRALQSKQDDIDEALLDNEYVYSKTDENTE